MTKSHSEGKWCVYAKRKDAYRIPPELGRMYVLILNKLVSVFSRKVCKQCVNPIRTNGRLRLVNVLF